MKSLIALAAIVLVLPLTAGAQSSKVDCTQASKGIVTLKSTTDRMSLDNAVLQAYSECLLISNPVIKKEVATALSTISKDADYAGSKCSLADAKAIELQSWISGRLSNDETGGNATFLIQQPISCGPVGTGLFEGTVANVFLELKIDENFKINEKDNSGVQTATVQFVGVSKFSTK